MASRPLQTCTLETGATGIAVRVSSVQRCLTPSQFGRLFGRRRTMPKLYGCGVTACVYESRDKGKVVKLTADSTDVSMLRRAQGSPYVPVLYRAAKLEGGPERWERRPRNFSENRPVYALTLEKLRPITSLRGERGSRVPDYVQCADDWQGAEACCDRSTSYVDAPTEQARHRRRRTFLKDCFRMARMREALEEDLKARGLESALGDAHSGNFGLDKQGRLKLLDMGMSSSAPFRVRTFRGARR